MINSKPTTQISVDFIINHILVRIVLFGALLGIISYHLQSFYLSVWHEKGLSLFWTISHTGLAVYLMLKRNAWDSAKSSGAITIYTIALTYVLHTNLLKIDSYTFQGANVLLMKSLIIAIVLAGLAGIATTFKK